MYRNCFDFWHFIKKFAHENYSCSALDQKGIPAVEGWDVFQINEVLKNAIKKGQARIYPRLYFGLLNKQNNKESFL